MNTVRVERFNSRTTFSADAGESYLTPGTRVVVESEAGPILSRTVGDIERAIVNAGTTKRIIRLATEEDVRSWDRCEQDRDRAMRVAVKATRRLRIFAKIVSAEVPLDRSKTLIFYSAENRIDVAKLARELSGGINGRVELRHMGVRDGAGVIGGVGSCGGELCCSTFLTKFSSISVRYAKDQGLSLNPGRITGQCGRLKCCLVYEEATYKEMKSYAPRRRNGAYTPKGAGNILDVDTVNRKVLVRLSSGMETFHIRDIRVVDRSLTDDEIRDAGPGKEQTILNQRRRGRGGNTSGKLTKQAASVLSEEYIWDDTAGSAEITEESAVPKKKRRRRKKPSDQAQGQKAQGKKQQQGGNRGGQEKKAQAGEQPSNQAKSGGQQPAGNGPPKKRRRRSRGGRKPGGQTANPQGGEQGANSSGGDGQSGRNRRGRGVNSGGGNSGGGNSGGGNSGGGN
ncbi:MAG: cell fate regulator YaaT (PSP1 superfamily), partial [Bradymonadia bacterium]